MIQKDFLINNPLSAGREIAEIARILKEIPHRDALLSVYETGFPAAQLKIIINRLKACDKNLKIAGISVYSIADMTVMLKGMRLNLILTESSDIEVVTIPCKPGQERRAIDHMKKRLGANPDIKAVQLFVCNVGLNTTEFLRESFKGREDIGVFGTLTSRELPEAVASRGDGYNILNVIGRQGANVKQERFAIGDALVSDGFVAVIFSGKDLYADLRYALGWHPVGREMPVTISENKGKWETCISEIDGMSPVDLYNEYLGVKPDNYFTYNICEFPLMVRRNETDICLIPLEYGDKGEIYFDSTIYEGEKLYLSFATHDEVLGAVRESLKEMTGFEPDALFLVLCSNRINFLEEDAKLEWSCFSGIAPDLALIHGVSEIYYHRGKGGVLNSAHVAAALREGKETGKRKTGGEYDLNCGHHHNIIPLSERMSVFMSKMTSLLENMALDAQAANQAKSAFLTAMSHEIRTPINAILGMDEMILRESSDPEILKYAEDIRSAGNSLLGLVNDILDFSKIEVGKMDIIPVEYEFASVLNDLYNIIKKRAEDKGLTVRLNIDPAIPSVLYGDEIRLKQVITNILTNAVKYTEKGSITLSVKSVGDRRVRPEGYVECHGSACFRNPIKLLVSVRDTGIGIKEEDKKRLFNAFERVDEKRNRTIEGTGLGLNITNRLLSLMDSELLLKSEYGKGSEFFFEIVQGISRDEPIGDINNRWEKLSGEQRKYREKFKAPEASILVVDDTAINLEVIKNLLKKTELSVDTAESGEEALKMVEKKAYDCIFLDHRMPNMDGFECLKRMKEMEGNLSKDAPIISLTANAVSGAREEYLTAGFSDYLSKPIDSGKLEDMLIRYLPGEKVQRLKDTEEDKEKESGIPDAGKSGNHVIRRLSEVRSLDVREGINNCGSEDAYLKVLNSFYSAIPEKADEIEGYFSADDIKNYTIKVHALKSSARIIGAKELSKEAEALEKAGDEGDRKRIERDTGKLLSFYRSFEEALQRILEPGEDEDHTLPEAPDPVLRDAIGSLRDFVQTEDYELSVMVLDSMKEYSLPPEEKIRFKKLRKLLSDLDWDGMKRLLERKEL